MDVLRNAPVAICLAAVCVFLASAGVNPARGQETPLGPDGARALQTALHDAYQDTNVMGAVAAVVFADGTSWTGAAGWSHPGRGLEMRPDMMFNVGSISKNYLAALTLRMVEKGALSLDDTVGDYFSGLSSA